MPPETALATTSYECKCGDAVHAAAGLYGESYVRGWIDGHLPRCDPDAYIAWLLRHP